MALAAIAGSAATTDPDPVAEAVIGCGLAPRLQSAALLLLLHQTHPGRYCDAGACLGNTLLCNGRNLLRDTSSMKMD